MTLHPVLLDKLNASLAGAPPMAFTRRDAALPRVPGKVHAVIGMRRVGKTTFLRQLLSGLGTPGHGEAGVFISFDDDRLAGIGADQLSSLLEELYRRAPELRGRRPVHWYLDEVQLVEGWDRFVRRVLDTEKVEIVVSGSSARMLSREVHTSLRGRGMETIIRPFSFREFLRHRGEEPASGARRWTPAERSLVEKRFREYLVQGGFPEAQGQPAAVRIPLLQGYVDTVLLRDIVERHSVSQVAALRWLSRHCLRNPGGAMSVHRMHRDLKSQGLAISKDAVHEMLGFLVDSFLLGTASLATESERRRNSNPRKVYPADPGLIGAFDASGRSNIGHALETVVFNEIENRRATVGYMKTEGGFEIDFHVRYLEGGEELVQACADPSEQDVLHRELRALGDAAPDSPGAARRLLVLTRDQIPRDLPPGVIAQPAYEWLLEPPE